MRWAAQKLGRDAHTRVAVFFEKAAPGGTLIVKLSDAKTERVATAKVAIG